HSRRCANGVRRAGWTCVHVTSSSPSTLSQCLSCPQVWRYEAPIACAACWIEPCSRSADSSSNSGLWTSAPRWPSGWKLYSRWTPRARMRGSLVVCRCCEDAPAAERRGLRLGTAQAHAHRAVLELGDLAERVERRVGELVDRR